jgi:hypothetical protein
MKNVFYCSTLFLSFISFGQLGYMRDFKKNSDAYYEMSIKDVREAIHKYNYVLDKNDADTNGIVYDVTKNPIDFCFFRNDPNSSNVIVGVLLREGNKHKLFFGEIDGSYDQELFDVIDQFGNEMTLVYKSKKKR